MLILGVFMTGPRSAGRPWTAAEQFELLQLLASGVKAAAIARKLKRSTGAIYTRANSLKKKLSIPARSLPSERAAFYHKALNEGRSIS
jgi:DNA-binding NarL/FixJ family response regulator